MILPDYKIREWARVGGLRPFSERLVNPASIDLRLHKLWRDMDNPEEVKESLAGVDGIRLYRRTPARSLVNRFFPSTYPFVILACTLETISLKTNIAGTVNTKTTPTRMGLGHPVAEWVDPGFIGQLTLVLHAHMDIVLRPGSRICQLVLHQVPDVEHSYAERGHYMHQLGPTQSYWKGEIDNVENVW